MSVRALGRGGGPLWSAAILAALDAFFAQRTRHKENRKKGQSGEDRRTPKVLIAFLSTLLAVAPEGRGDGYEYPPVRRDDMEARLAVSVAERGPAPGRAQVTLTLTVTGRPALEVDVESPRKRDQGPWKLERSTSSWTLDGNRITWSRVIDLVQVKPGALPLPVVKARLRDDPGSAHWDEVEWVDVLREARPGVPPDGPEPETPPPTRRWLPAAVGALAGVLILAVVGWAVRRRRAVRPGPLSPATWALGELERIEAEALNEDGERWHTQLAEVLRHYLAERFGLRAPQQTSAEFLQAASRLPNLAAPQQELLRVFFDRCDLAKFARAGTSLDECRRTAALARTFIEQTADVTGPLPSNGSPSSMSLARTRG